MKKLSLEELIENQFDWKNSTESMKIAFIVSSILTRMDTDFQFLENKQNDFLYRKELAFDIFTEDYTQDNEIAIQIIEGLEFFDWNRQEHHSIESVRDIAVLALIDFFNRNEVCIDISLKSKIKNTNIQKTYIKRTMTKQEQLSFNKLNELAGIDKETFFQLQRITRRIEERVERERGFECHPFHYFTPINIEIEHLNFALRKWNLIWHYDELPLRLVRVDYALQKYPNETKYQALLSFSKCFDNKYCLKIDF